MSTTNAEDEVTSIGASLDDQSRPDKEEEEQQEEKEEESPAEELDRLQKECRAMVTLIHRLHEEEEDLRDKNIMLAREALLCGFDIHNLEAPPPKRRRTPAAATTVAKKQKEPTTTNTTTTTTP
jgi:hypothetical protein